MSSMVMVEWLIMVMSQVWEIEVEVNVPQYCMHIDAVVFQ